MDDQTILLCCAFGIPFVLIAVGIAVVGFILRRVRPDLYMTDEEKLEAEKKLMAEMSGTDADKDHTDTDIKQQEK